VRGRRRPRRNSSYPQARGPGGPGRWPATPGGLGHLADRPSRAKRFQRPVVVLLVSADGARSRPIATVPLTAGTTKFPADRVRRRPAEGAAQRARWRDRPERVGCSLLSAAWRRSRLHRPRPGRAVEAGPARVLDAADLDRRSRDGQAKRAAKVTNLSESHARRAVRSGDLPAPNVVLPAPSGGQTASDQVPFLTRTGPFSSRLADTKADRPDRKTRKTRPKANRILLWRLALGLVGARGFEPPTSRSRTVRSSQAELRPVCDRQGHF